MQAVLYCIDLYAGMRSTALATGPLAAADAYRLGLHYLAERFDELKHLYDAMQLTFQSFGSSALRSAFYTEIPAFLTQYDRQFAPGDSIILFDYPVLRPADAASGAISVLSYLRSIKTEQQFLTAVHPRLTDKLRNSCSAQGGENLCTAVLLHMAGYMMLEKPMFAVLAGDDYRHLEQLLLPKTIQAMERHMKTLLGRMTAQFFHEDEAVQRYLIAGVPALVAHIRLLVENHATRRMFLS